MIASYCFEYPQCGMPQPNMILNEWITYVTAEPATTQKPRLGIADTILR